MSQLINFSKYKKENFVYLNTLEDNAIPIDICSKILIDKFEKKNEYPVVIVELNSIINNESDIEKIYYNLVNQATNLDVNIDFNLCDVSKEYLKYLLNQWFKDTRSVKYVISIINLLEEVILYSLNKDDSYISSKEHLEYLSTEFKEDINKLIDFLNAIPLYLITALEGFIETNSNIENLENISNDEKSNIILDIIKKNNINIIDDINIVPKNIICLFYNPSFLTKYYSIDHKTNNTYYFQQFTQYIFNGHSFYYYFANENNIIYKSIENLNNQELTKELVDITKFLNK